MTNIETNPFIDDQEIDFEQTRLIHGKTKPILIVLSVVSVLALMFGVAGIMLPGTKTQFSESRLPETKTESTCEGDITTAEYIVIDGSDELAEHQFAYLEEIAGEVLRERVHGKRIYVYVLTGNELNPLKQVAAFCDNREHYVNDNPSATRRKTTEIRSKMIVAMKSVLTGDLPRSPIIEGLHALTRRLEFKGGLNDSDKIHRTVWLVSDGLQNSSKARAYGKRKGSSLDYMELFGVLNFRSANVVFAEIGRPTKKEQVVSSIALEKYLKSASSNLKKYEL